MRLFVAITPATAALDELDAAVAPHRPAWPELRWTSPEAWHVTLAFLGNVDESERVTGRLAARLERAAARYPRLELSAAGAGAFPSGQKARVLWTGISGDQEALGALAASVAAGARRAGAPPPDEGRRFRPHITLARCRMPVDVRLLVAALTDFAGQSWIADRIHLIRSRLNGTPRYQTVGSWPLAGGSAGWRSGAGGTA